MSEIIWYILDKIDDVFKKIDQTLTSDGFIGIYQFFPQEQKFGIDLINGLNGFEKFLLNKTPFEIDKKNN